MRRRPKRTRSHRGKIFPTLEVARTIAEGLKASLRLSKLKRFVSLGIRMVSFGREALGYLTEGNRSQSATDFLQRRHSCGALRALLTLFLGAGSFFETEGVRGFRYEGAGLAAVAVAVALAAWGKALMLVALREEQGKGRREIIIVLSSSVIGLSTVISNARRRSPIRQ